MAGENVVASTNQFQTLLIAFVLIVAVVYFFIETRRFDMRITQIEKNIKKILQNPPPLPPRSDDNVGDNVDDEIVMDNVSMVEQPVSMDGVPMTEPPVSMDSVPVDVTESTDLTHPPNIVEVDNTLEEEDTQDRMNNIIESMELMSKVDEPRVEDLTVEESFVEEVAVEEVAVEEPAVEEPAVEEVAVDEAAVEEAKVEEPPKELLEEQEQEEELTINRIDDITDEEMEMNENIPDPVIEDVTQQPLLTEVTEYINYQHHTIKELKDILFDMDLPTSGNKTKLIQRIVSNKNKISK